MNDMDFFIRMRSGFSLYWTTSGSAASPERDLLESDASFS
jgi:hypothetical protein